MIRKEYAWLSAGRKWKKMLKTFLRKETSVATTFKNWSVGECVQFINSIFDSFLKYSAVSNDLLGKRVLEIGHGENVGLALKFLTLGAGKVVCIDKFHAPRDTEKEYAIYQGLRSTLTQEEKVRFDECIDLKNNEFHLNANKIECLYGLGIEDALEKFSPESFDLVYSNAVLEHIDDIDTAMAVMPQLLATGGSMIHSIDFKDHGMFTSAKLHPLTFLSISNKIYRNMTSIGYPNRKTIQFYREKMAVFAGDFELLVSQVFHEPDLSSNSGKYHPSNLVKDEKKSIGYATLITYKEDMQANIDYSVEMLENFKEYREKLALDFRGISAEDLMVACILLIAEKKQT